MNQENKNKIKKILIVLVCVFLLSGCTKTLKDKNEKVISLYEKNKVNISKLPSCKKFNPLGNYEGLWTSIFVKPLAWMILQIGYFLNNFGFALIIACLLIRVVLMPITQKTANQSELIKKAQPELERLEKKYKGKDSQEDQTKKAQEMMLIYQKYKINPLSGCLLAFIQLPLLFAFLEAINRTPAIFENNFLVYQMGTTPWVGLTQHNNYWYILLIVLIIGTTFLSFKKTMKDQSGPTANQMKYTIYFMLAMVSVASLTLPTALGIYWISSSTFTILQNLYVERRKNNEEV